MPVLFMTPEGRKVAINTGMADNSQGTAAADITVKIRFDDLEQISAIMSVFVIGAQAYVKSTATGPDPNAGLEANEAQIVVNVPAGATALVTALVLGY